MSLAPQLGSLDVTNKMMDKWLVRLAWSTGDVAPTSCPLLSQMFAEAGLEAEGLRIYVIPGTVQGSGFAQVIGAGFASSKGTALTDQQVI